MSHCFAMNFLTFLVRVQCFMCQWLLWTQVSLVKLNILKVYFYCFKIMCVCVSVCRHVHMSTCVWGIQKRVPDLLELELQADMSCPTFIPGTEL